MTKTEEFRATRRLSATRAPGHERQADHAPLLILFVLSRQDGARRVRCRGCREVVPPIGSTPAHIRGTVELDGQSVPIIDANVWLRASPTLLDSSTCIVIAERQRQAERYCGGVLVPDIDEVMRLAAGDFDSIGRADAGANMHLVLTMDEDEAARAELTEGPDEPDPAPDGWTWRLGRIFRREICV